MATESTVPVNTTASSELQYYACDDAALEAHRKSCPWKDDPVYFKKVSLSPSSVMKMVRSLLVLLLLLIVLEYLAVLVLAVLLLGFRLERFIHLVW